MNFTEIAENRQSCRSYDPDREIEQEKLDRILESARLSPSACNGQPYAITVCRGGAAQGVAKATQGMGMNKFASDAPVLLVISERPYVATAALGAKVKKNDYRSIDIGIVAAYITAEASAQGLGSCFSVGSMTPRSAKSVTLMRPCASSSRLAIPRMAKSFAQRSARICQSL